MTLRLGSMPAALVVMAASACGNNPNSPTAGVLLVEGTYRVNVSVSSTVEPPLLGFTLACPTATASVSQDSRASMRRDGSRWRAVALTSQDGVFEFVFDPGPSTSTVAPIPVTGTARGVVSESRLGTPPTSVRIGDGATPVVFTGTVSALNASARGTISGPTSITGDRITPFDCAAGTINWSMIRDATL